MVNYYSEFGLNINASLEEIQKELFSQKKKWSNRVNNQNLEARQAAETKLQLLQDATIVFSDSIKRKEYDDNLKKSGMNTPVPVQQEPELMQTNTTNAKDWAKQLYEDGRDVQTIEFCEQEIRNGNNEFEIYYYLMFSYAAVGRIDDALNAGNRGLQALPHEAVFYVLMAKICVRNNYNLEMALSYSEKALEMIPNSPYYKGAKVECLLMLDREEEANVVIEEHLSTYPNDKEFKGYLADAYLLCGNKYYCETSSGGSYIPDSQSYNKIKTYCQKAIDTDRNNKTESAFNVISKLGKRQVNKDNLKGIIPFWVVFAGVGFMAGSSESIIFAVIVSIICATLLYFSFKPIWMIEKMQLTGRRDISNTVSYIMYFIIMSIVTIWKIVLGFGLSILHMAFETNRRVYK